MNTEQLIEHLLDPKTYPHPVEVITTIETHISIVFLTGRYAYKLKKPVNFGFLDFSSIANRKKFCHLEVSLNKRTAPELYLGVQEVYFQNSNFKNKNLNTYTEKESIRIVAADSITDNQQAEPIDYLVKMRQFNPNHVLGKILKQGGELNLSLIEKLASQISQFHQNAEIVNSISELGLPKTQLQPMLDNLPILFQHFANKPDTFNKLNSIESWTLKRFEECKSFILERREQGFIKACHGDLHLDNIAIINDSPLLFDGIEFNEHFRWIDALSDLAFLLIDLEFRGNKNASYQVLSLYLSKTLDYNSLILLNFYRVYRTLVRAKITTLRAQQLLAGSIDYQQVVTTAEQYIFQAHSYLQPNLNPKCILLQGVSGSGKSFLANQLLTELSVNAIIISSDRVRKSLFGIESTDRLSEDKKAQLYSPAMNKKTYQALLRFSQTCLANGFNVIVDATFLKLSHRQPFYDMAKSCNSQSFLISLLTPPELAEAAIIQRLKENTNPSDADVNIMLKQLKVLEPVDATENAIQLDMAQVRQYFPKESLQDFLHLPID